MHPPSAKAPLAIVVEQLHPRACYTLETVLGEFMGFGLRIVEAGDAAGIAAAQSDGIPVLHYGRIPSPTLPNLPCNGLLYDDIVRPIHSVIDWYGGISASMHTEDHLARIFYLLTQYPLLQPGASPSLDGHGRYPDGDGKPVVHTHLDLLGEVLRPHLRQLPAPRRWDYEITIDVDQPWKYLHKPAHVRWGGLLRDLARGTDTRERRQAQRHGRDPFDALGHVMALCPPEKTRVFFLVGGDHPHDSRFDIGMRAYAAYVGAYQAAGYTVGLHPSYASSDQHGLIARQKAALEKVAGSVSSSRQHFLRYKTPQTLRELATAGITHDYTLCQSTRPGLPTGVALPYRWFDLQRNVATTLTLVPAVVMDRTLQQYMGLEPAAAQAALEETLAMVKAIGGRFVIILHNETFSDSGEWKGWRDMLARFLPQLRP